ncbi:MAG: hypothetical protein LBL21_02745 [Rickettsiales bacterium]|jgi:hypothetical protein|nr:hypothetical protein [Rickettsiales bacterium]
MKKTPGDQVKKLYKELSGLRASVGSLEDFVDGYIMPRDAMDEMVSAYWDVLKARAEIDAEKKTGMAKKASKISGDKTLAAFLGKISRLSGANCFMFGRMIDIVEAAKGQCVGGELSDMTAHMLSTAGVAGIFLDAVSLQAQMLGAMRNIPKQYGRLEKTRKVESGLWLGFADMIVRTVGGSEPTLDRILAETGFNGAPAGIGMLVAYSADMDRAWYEVGAQAERYALRNAGAMRTRLRGDWVRLFLTDMRGMWRRFERINRSGLYDPYDPCDSPDPCDQLDDIMADARTDVRIYQFPIEKIRGRGGR